MALDRSVLRGLESNGTQWIRAAVLPLSKLYLLDAAKFSFAVEGKVDCLSAFDFACQRNNLIGITVSPLLGELSNGGLVHVEALSDRSIGCFSLRR